MQSKSLDHLDKDTGLQENGRFLQNVLRANAIFSTISGLFFIFFASSLADLVGIPTPMILAGIGVMILPFALYVYKISTVEKLNSKLVWVIIELDLLWVAASAILLLTNLVPLTIAGKWAVGLSAAIVAVFAILEYVGLRKARADFVEGMVN